MSVAAAVQRLHLLPDRLAVAQLAPGGGLPAWWPSSGLRHASWTGDELSLVCAEDAVPEGVRCRCGWRALMLQGPFAFELTGILKSVLDPLAEAGIGIFALSTYDTDYVLVQAHQLPVALAALRSQGHAVSGD